MIYGKLIAQPIKIGKGTGANGHGILNASGLQYLIGSNMHILSEALYRGFEAPLLHELDMYKEKTTENEEGYRKEEAKRGKELRKRESEYLKLARQKRRSKFPAPLVHLQFMLLPFFLFFFPFFLVYRY